MNHIVYNRYIPAADGGHICQRIAEVQPREASSRPAGTQPSPQQPCGDSRPGLLQRLLPRGLEADDLLILLILLLLLLDCGDDDDSLTALLAVAAFLILK